MKSAALAKSRLLIIAGIWGVILSGCGPIPSTGHYRVSVDVEANGTVYTGTSVQRFSTRPQLVSTIDTIKADAFGEALAVKIGNRGTLFMIMRDGAKDPSSGSRTIGGEDLMLYHLHLTDGRGHAGRWIGKWAVSRDNMPAMIAFRNLQDPTTAFQVDPDNLSTAFGPGTKLKSVTVARTWDGMTYGNIERMLPWLKQRGPGTMLNGQVGRSILDRSLSGNLEATAFIRKK